MFHHFIGIHYQKTQPRPQVFSVNRSIIWQFCCTIEVISSHIAKFFQIWSTVAGYDELDVEFYPIRNGEILCMNNIPIFLRSVLVARFQSTWSCSIFPIFPPVLNTMFSDV